MKKKLLCTILVICYAVCLCLGALTACSKKTPPEVSEGTVYVTGVESFWAGIGHAYMQFDYIAEPEEGSAAAGYIFSVMVSSGGDYESWLTGSWSLEETNGTYGDLSLTATWETGENSTYLSDAESGETKTYSLKDGKYTIGVVLPSAGTIHFTLDPVNDKAGSGGAPTQNPEHTEHVDENNDGKCDECGADMPAAPSAGEVQMALYAADQGMTSELALMEDNTWSLGISYYDGMPYQPVASGTWAFDEAYNIVLTVTKDEGDVLAEDTYMLNVDYTTFEYSGLIVCNVPTIGERNFMFSAAEDNGEHFTVSFDLNYDGAPAMEPAKTTTFTLDDNGKSIVKEYVANAPAVPEREGYRFAGWYTVKDPTLVNGASEQEYIFGQKISAFAVVSIPNDVKEIKGDTTLYARWVQVKEISTEAQLREMANDLSGWYRLTADITLTEPWTPVGKYYANYESYEPAWWQYAFRGCLEGNGHKINGLTLNNLDLAEDAVSAVEGSAKGTIALFGSAVNCEVTNLTISGAKINVTYAGTTHAYVSVLAGFVQGTDTLFENCTVENAAITVNLTNNWYYAVAGLFAGHWGGNANNCSVVNSTIRVNVTSDANVANIPAEAAYLGGLVGEGYAWLNGCKADVDIHYTVNDTRTDPVDLAVYLGGATASSTYMNGVCYEGAITVDYTRAAGKVDFYLGGLSGYQRYGYIMNCSADAAMTFNNKNVSAVEGQAFTAGGILGANDVMYGLMGAAYFSIPNGCRVTSCLDMSTLTTTGTKVFAGTLNMIGYVPEDFMVDAYNEQFSVDLTSFKREDGSYTFFGAFNCVRVTGAASAADGDGNITAIAKADLYGSAAKSTLGDSWTYENGKLPTPKIG